MWTKKTRKKLNTYATQNKNELARYWNKISIIKFSISCLVPLPRLFSSVHFSRWGMSDSWDCMDCSTYASLPITNSWSLLKLMSIELVMPSNHLILYCALLPPPLIFPSIRVFSSESVLCIRRPKYWSFSFCLSPSNEYSGLTSFGMDWLDLLAVQGTFKSLLQQHSSKASILWCSAFFRVQLSHPYMTTGNTTALIRQTFLGKVCLSIRSLDWS